MVKNMRIYAIHQYRKPGVSARDETHLVLTRQGFALWAALLPPLWLVWRRLWWEASAVLAFYLALLTWQPAVGLAVPLLLASSLLVGFEGGTLHEFALWRRGWRLQSVIIARNALEAEIRFWRLQAQDSFANRAGSA